MFLLFFDVDEVSIANIAFEGHRPTDKEVQHRLTKMEQRISVPPR